ncbi:unnamed protein product [Heterobilharzia americana]|nr:unnamed protein product [Heterobilharzia americana]
MQDFPSITDIISNSPTPIDHPPKYTTAYEQNNNVNKSMKSVLNETNYDILTSNSTLSVDKEKVINVNNLHNNNNNNKSFLPQIHPLNVSNEKYPSNQNVHMSSNCATTTTAAATTTTTSITTATSSSSTTITTSSGKHIPLSDRNNMEVSSILSSWSTSVPSTVKSSIESKDTFPVRGTKASNINSGGSVPVQSSLCRLLLDAQLEPEEISDAVANAQVSEISYCHSTESKEQRFGTSLKDDMRFTSFADSSHSCDEQLRISGSTINTSSCQSVTPYSIAPVEWNDDDLQQLIHEATVNSDDKVLEKNPCTSSPSSLLLLPPKRHPSASSKEIAEEVEILCEILRRDELERNHPKPESSYNPCDTTNSTSYISESPCSKRSRFSSSTSISEHQTLDGDNVINDGELTYRNEVNWQNDAKAVARICEQLQQGLVSDKSTYTTLNTTTDFSSYSIISNNNTSTSCNNLLECSISRNDEKIISKHSPLDNNSALVTTRTIWSGYSPQPSNTVQRNAVGGSSASINKAAVAAALASQQAAASQRNQLMNQRLLAEQRKRLIQHQLYNQVAVYSLNSRQHIPTYEYCNPDTVTAVDTSHQGNPFIINESMMDGGEGGGGVEMLLHSNTITATTTTCSTPHPLLHIIPSKSLRKKTLCSNGIQNNNLNILNLNATTVHSSNSASISTTSKLTGFYPPHQHHNHRPEDLSKFLKEVGPNVRVQLSCTIPTSDRQQSNYMNKIPHVYPTSNNSITTTKMKQSSKQLTTTSIFPNSQMFIQSGNPTNKIHFPVATVYSNPSTLIVATTSSVSSVNNSSRLVKAELRQALVGRQVIYQNNNNNPGDNHRGFHCSQVSRQFSDPIPMNIYEAYSSTEGGVDHFSTSSLSSLPCTSRISSNHQAVHNPHITYSLCPAQNSNSSVNCQQWSPTTSQSISVHQVPLNSDNMSSLSSNNAYPPQSVHLVHGGGSGYHSQGFSSSNEIEKKNKTDTYDFLNHNNSSLCFNTLNHSNIYRLTPSSLSPISVSANTSPSSSTTSQTGLLKSPICQSTEFAYTSCESSLMTVNPNNYPYEVMLHWNVIQAV